MYKSMCEWCGYMHIMLNACVLYVYLTKDIYFKIYKVSCNMWADAMFV